MNEIREINNRITAKCLMDQGSQRHYLAVEQAHARQYCRACEKIWRQVRRRKIARLALDICLTAASVIGILAAIGLLATVAS